MDSKGLVSAAIAEWREPIRLKKEQPEAHANLGRVLAARGRHEEAIAEYREAVRYKKDFALAHYSLGNELLALGRLDQAVAAYHEAIRFRPDDDAAHYNLGVALLGQGRLDEAISAYQEAIRLKPDDVAAHASLAKALGGKGRLSEAIAECREAIRLNRDYAVAHLNLGAALAESGRVDDAVVEFREVLRLCPDSAEAHVDLGQMLMRQGRFRQAVAELRQGQRLGARNPGWPYPSARWVREAEAAARLDDRLPTILKGKAQPKDPTEQVALAELCQQPYKRLYAASARLYADAFAAQPRLREDLNPQHRYNAACAAALAGCGRGKDQPRPNASQRRAWRQQALDWLRSDLAAYAKLVDTGPAPARAAVGQRLERWRQDTDLAGVRGDAAIAKLPGAEREGWRKLWADVADLLARAQRTAAPAKTMAAK